MNKGNLSDTGWMVILVIVFLVLAVACFTLDFILFHDSAAIVQYLLEETGFVFISVILVTLVIDKIITSREIKNRLQKLNMVIGVFFSEIGTELISFVADFDRNYEELSRHLQFSDKWKPEDFKRAQEIVKQHHAKVAVTEGDLKNFKKLLHDNRDFLLALLQNPSLLENESFTDLLWALFHMAEELSSRKDLDDLSNADKVHLSGDLARVYKALVCEWLGYLNHLENNYPFLYSFEMRTNPFNPSARVEFNDIPQPEAR